MRIDLQIRAHLGQQVAADLLLAILEGGEFVAEVEAGVQFAMDAAYPAGSANRVAPARKMVRI